MTTFQKRLTAVLKDGSMTVADLTNWFDRPHATVRSWVVDGREPRGPAGDKARSLLYELEIKIRKGLKIPVELSNTARPEFIRELRRGRSSSPRLSSPHSS